MPKPATRTAPAAKVPVLLTLPEVKQISRSPEGTVRDWIATGKLASRRPGRRRLVHRRDLAAFLGLEVHELELGAPLTSTTGPSAA